MRLLFFILLLLGTACESITDGRAPFLGHSANNEISQSNPIEAENPALSANSSNEINEEERRVQFGQNNWLSGNLQLTAFTIKDYSPEFFGKIQVYLSSEESGKIKDLAQLKSFCRKNNYETASEFSKVKGRINLALNPLNFEKARLLAFRTLNEPVTEVLNPFIISKVTKSVAADFISIEDKKLIEDGGLLGIKNELDDLVISLFNPFMLLPNQRMSSVFLRTICGIADGKAHIVYNFEDEDKRLMKVNFNQLSFKFETF